MTELQVGLIGLGAVAVVGVLAYNKWQEYRLRKTVEQVLHARHEDVLLNDPATGNDEAEIDEPLAPSFEREAAFPRTQTEDETPVVRSESVDFDARIEPVLGLDEARREPVIAPPEPAPEVVQAPAEVPVFAAPPPSQGPSSARAQPPEESRDATETHHLLSPVIDYVVTLEAVEPAPAYQILESQREVLSRVRKPMHWIGYNEYAREWEPIVDDGRSEYRRIRVGLQLVDRKGALGENDLSVFHIAMQDLADELMAMADFPPRQPALDAAAKLDEFCADVDIQVGINVIAQGQVFPGTKLRALAEAAGMVIDADGRFVRCDDEGNVLFVLLNQDTSGFSVDSMKTMSAHGLTFLLDVPRVSHGERVFNQMVDLARRFAEVLRGALVDDNHRPLSESALDPIRRQVGQYQASMAAKGLPAGGALARRLFS